MRTSPKTIRSLFAAGVALAALTAIPVAAQAQTQREAGVLPDVALQAQSRVNLLIDRQRFLARGREDGSSSIFGEIFDNNHEFKTQSGVAAFQAETRGGVFGFQTELADGFTVGGAFSRETGDIRHPKTRGGAGYRGNTIHGFASYDLQGLIFDFSADYGRTKFENIARAVTVKPGAATGSTEGSHWRLGAGVRTDFMFDGGMRISPSLSYDYTHIVVDAYKEKGPAGTTTAFQRQSINQQRLIAAVDFEGASWDFAQGMAIVPVAGVRYVHALSGEGHNLRYTTAPAAAVTSAFPGYAGGFNASIGAELRMDSGWALGARYSRALSGDQKSSDTIGVSLNLRF